MGGCSAKPKEFTLERWESAPTKRIDIISDFLEKHDLMGLNRDEILVLLGQPSVITSVDRGIDKDSDAYPPRVFDLTKGNYVTYLLTEEFPPESARALYIELNTRDVAIGVYIIALQT